MIQTMSKFYYGYEVTYDNRFIDFKEGVTDYFAQLRVGIYSATDFCVEVARAMNEAGNLTYSCSFNRENRKVTLSASGTFSLLNSSGDHSGQIILVVIGGFNAVDLTGAATYLSQNASGYEYRPQFKLQDYVDRLNLKRAIEASVNITANGRTEVVSFGNQEFYEMNIRMITNRTYQYGSYIESSVIGVESARQFMDFIIKRGPVEFMPDRDSYSSFSKVALDSTEESSNGTGYRLIEELSLGLLDHFRTGKLVFRVLE